MCIRNHPDSFKRIATIEIELIGREKRRAHGNLTSEMEFLKEEIEFYKYEEMFDEEVQSLTIASNKSIHVVRFEVKTVIYYASRFC